MAKAYEAHQWFALPALHCFALLIHTPPLAWALGPRCERAFSDAAPPRTSLLQSWLLFTAAQPALREHVVFRFITRTSLALQLLLFDERQMLSSTRTR